jgi:hypothetical protein
MGTVSPAGTVNVSHNNGFFVRLVVNPMGRIRGCGSAGNAEGFTLC